MARNPDRGRYQNPDGSSTWEYFAAISCSSIMFCTGCVLGWTSPAAAILIGPNAPIPFSSSELYSVLVAGGLGTGLAPILIMFLADKLGRKNSLLAISVPMILNWGLIAVAKDGSVIAVARFIAGLAASLGLCLAPMYMGEIASVKLRGALGSVISTMSNSGLLSMFLAVPYMSLKTSACICLSIATLSMISLWFIPESPYFLTMAGRIDEAEGALEKLRGKTDVAEELDLIKRTVRREDQKEGEQGQGPSNKWTAFKQLIRVRGHRKAFYINFMLLFVLQFGGYVITMVYSVIIFQAMKTRLSANICAAILATLQLIFNILTIFIIERLGRRLLICISGLVSGACTLVVGIYFYLMDYMGLDVTPYSMIPVAVMFLNMIAMSVGLMPLQMVIQSETLATEIKALVTCMLGIASGFMAIVATGLYLKVAITWGFGHSIPFFVFCAVTWTSTALVAKMLPETKGKTFLEIQRELNA